MCMHGALCSSSINWTGNVITIEKNVLTFDPTPGVECVCKDRVCACMLLFSSFPYLLTPTPRFGEGGLQAKYLLQYCCMHHSL